MTSAHSDFTIPVTLITITCRRQIKSEVVAFVQTQITDLRKFSEHQADPNSLLSLLVHSESRGFTRNRRNPAELGDGDAA